MNDFIRNNFNKRKILVMNELKLKSSILKQMKIADIFSPSVQLNANLTAKVRTYACTITQKKKNVENHIANQTVHGTIYPKCVSKTEEEMNENIAILKMK